LAAELYAATAAGLGPRAFSLAASWAGSEWPEILASPGTYGAISIMPGLGTNGEFDMISIRLAVFGAALSLNVKIKVYRSITRLLFE
jgi:hypothetical protein